MRGKGTRATGAGSISIGRSARGAKISSNVAISRNAETKKQRSPESHGNSVTAEAPGAIAIGDRVENSDVTTNVTIGSDSGLKPDHIEFPQLEMPVDVILRVAHASPEEIRFDALARDGRQVGPFRRHIGKNPEQFAARLSDIGRDAVVSDEQRNARLRAIGLEIADLIPKELLEGPEAILGAALTKKGTGPSLLILTNEAYIPWELAKLTSIGGTTRGERYLGEVAKVGRWPINETFPTPRGGLELGEFHVVVASSYEKAGARNDLPHAVKEAEYVVERFEAKRHEANRSDFEDWLNSPRSNAETLLLALHGYSDPRADDQRLILGDGSKITPDDLLRFDKSDQARPYSLVFINACQCGTGGQSLGQLSGFPGRLTRRGAGAVVAPLWEVDDAEACDFAKGFFVKALDDGMEIGAALKSLRQDGSRSHSITRFAYIFYGHPLLKLNRS